MSGGTKLIIAFLVIGGTTAYMAYLGASEHWQYYLTSEECVKNQHALMGKRLRVSGEVVTGTLHNTHPRQVTFALVGGDHPLSVVFRGTVPDNLVEGIEVVVEGRLDGEGTIQANKLLTKCASKYSSAAAESGGDSSQNSRERGDGR